MPALCFPGYYRLLLCQLLLGLITLKISQLILIANSVLAVTAGFGFHTFEHSAATVLN